MVKKKRSKSTEKIDVKNHILVPKHEKCSEAEKKSTLSRYNIQAKDLPKISMYDPALFNVDVKPGDLVKISRESATAGDTVFYRVVIEI